MESEHLEEIREQLIPKDEEYKMWLKIFKPKPAPRYIPKAYVNFEQYVQENCHNKIKILNRATFHDIKRPILIFFNHFNEKCAYHTKWLDGLYQVSLQFGEFIDFIAADFIDKDIIYPEIDPIWFIMNSTIVEPETACPEIFTIDEQKRTEEYQYSQEHGYKVLNDLWNVCEKLINGTLYLSQPIPENNDKIIKIAVHLNFNELVLKSSKNIFLIIDSDCINFWEYEQYEKIALVFKDSNLDFVYMEAKKNCIPFEYYIQNCPSFLYIPCNDKSNYIHYRGGRTGYAVKTFLQKVLQDPEFVLKEQQKPNFHSGCLRKIVRLNEILKSITMKNYHNFLKNILTEFFK